MTVRAGGDTGTANIADRLSLGNALPFADREGAQMPVEGHRAVSVVQDHTVAVAAVDRSLGHCAAVRRDDGDAAVGGDVDARVGFLDPGDRMNAQAETAGHIAVPRDRPGKDAGSDNLRALALRFFLALSLRLGLRLFPRLFLTSAALFLLALALQLRLALPFQILDQMLQLLIGCPLGGSDRLHIRATALEIGL